MIKKIKENQYVKLVHELLQNQRTRGLVKLVLWMIFFVFVFSAFNVRGSKPKQEVSSFDRWKTGQNYKYHITFEYNDENHVLEGARNVGNERFTLDGKTYYMDSQFLYVLEGYDRVFMPEPVLFGYNPLKLRPEFLYEVYSNGKLEYTTNYENGKTKKSYSVNTAKFVELYKGLIMNDESVITIDFVEQNDMIVEVDLDLSEFMKYDFNQAKHYQVKIIYTDFGNVTINDVE